MPSPSTSTLRSGTVSRFSGGGALEKFSIRFGACCCCCCCWNGANTSPPNQPPPNPPPLRGCCCGTGAGGRGGPPKLKNCAEAGPTTPTNSATATANAISGPLWVNRRKKDFGFGMRSVAMDRLSDHHNSGIRPQAGRFPDHRPGIGRSRQGGPRKCRLPGYRAGLTDLELPTPEPLQHVGGGKSVRGGPDRGLEPAQGLPRLAAELTVGRAAIEAALRQQ